MIEVLDEWGVIVDQLSERFFEVEIGGGWGINLLIYKFLYMTGFFPAERFEPGYLALW